MGGESLRPPPLWLVHCFVWFNTPGEPGITIYILVFVVPSCSLCLHLSTPLVLPHAIRPTYLRSFDGTHASPQTTFTNVLSWEQPWRTPVYCKYSAS